MHELRVYSPTLEFLGIVEDYTSLLWVRRYNDTGEFELKAPITENNVKLLQPGNIVTKKGDADAGRIGDLSNEESPDKAILSRNGLFLTEYLDWRLIKNTFNFSGKVEDGIHAVINNAIAIPQLVLAPKNNFVETVSFQATMKKVGAMVQKLTKSAGLGYRIRPDFKSKTLLFEIYRGVDKSDEQASNSRVSFSEQYENLNNVLYSYNDQNYRTYFIIGGQGEGKDRIYVTMGGGEGLNLREEFINASDLSAEGLTETEYKAVLLQRGIEKKESMGINESLECTTLPEVNFEYKKHYDLGDIVTQEKDSWGISMDKRITEITEIFEKGGISIALTFGDPQPETIDWSDE